jgi:hypothetical protein
MKNLQVQLVRPPVTVRRASAGCLPACHACYRALAFLVHEVSLLSLTELCGELLVIVLRHDTPSSKWNSDGLFFWWKNGNPVNIERTSMVKL